MQERLYSNSWYRVQDLKPRLRSHAKLHRHHYRGELWYVLEDPANLRFHRFNPDAYRVIGLMDGRRTVQEIWDRASELLGDSAPTQDQVIQLLGQLHGADVLQCDVPPDTAEVLDRYEKRRRSKWLGQIMSPLFWRFPLFDPERLLNRLMPFVRPLFTPWAAALWMCVVTTGIVLAFMHWSDLSENVLDRVLATQNLVLLFFIFPVFKALHEFGHAFAVKAYGGEVHEMGIMLLVLTPMPYVDASAASAFRSKRQRILVGASGMFVELFLASLALMLWLNVEPGVTRTVLFNIVFIAGVSTILFNINPLLRFDGYYILSDLIEIPNLRARSTRYLGFLVQLYLFGHKEAKAPPSTRGERIWFAVYGPASFVYRVLILTGIILFIASRFFFIGVALALWGLVAWGVFPVAKALKYVFAGPQLRRVRRRAVAVTSGAVAGVVVLICFVPAPLRQQAEGVIWISENSIVRAGEDGFIQRILATEGARVKPGDPLMICRDELVETDVKVAEAELAVLKARHDEIWLRDRVEAAMIEEQIEEKAKNLARARERLAERIVRSRAAGVLVIPNAEDLPGRYVRRGTPLAQVLDLSSLTARVVVSQEAVHLVRHRTRGVQVRLAERLDATLPAVIRREVPAASEELPSSALGSLGGGEIATDPTDRRGVKAIQRLFQFDVELPAPSRLINVGGRVFVRFDHGWEPLAARWYRSLRRLFLSRFDV